MNALIDETARFRLAVEDDSGSVTTSPAAFLNREAALTAAEKVNGVRVLRGKAPYNRICTFQGEKLVSVKPLEDGEE